MNKLPEQIFKTPNKAGRPKGSKNKRTIIREALTEQFADGEKGFWLAIAQMAKGGDMQAAAMLADRLYPRLKPQSDLITLPEPLEGTAGDMARQLVQMAGKGEIPSSQARELLSALADVCKIIELQELQARLDKLEKTLLPEGKK